eukprot:TRINITY_DN8644_c0_g1_i1.p1 TRINITY_DN8644_c0_g1~~TRINITY_DN8644_c0_g1_i1.p1  ORF type:complete len:441 (+),score=32.05 TRINITY_DN8644_c0_g1_i1:127-1449(+)
MASEDESPVIAVSESEEEREITEKEEEEPGLTDVEEEADDDVNADGNGDDDEEVDDVVLLLAVLNLDDPRLKKRKIWRRIAVPADFSLLELHVALQNAFDWEDTHLHDFTQPHRHSWRRLLNPASVLDDAKEDGAAAAPGAADADAPPPPLPDTSFRGFGRTDLKAVAELLAVDLDSLPPGGARTFKTVAGGKEDAADDLILTPAPLEGGAGAAEEEGDAEGKGGAEVVFAEHADAEGAGEAEDKAAVLTAGPNEVLDERAFEVGAVFSRSDPLVVYQYDFGLSYEVALVFEGRAKATEGVNYPTCLAGAGASPAEDGADMDDVGALLPAYEYSDFAVLDVLANFEKTFEDSWPVGPGSEDSLDAPRCYMCRYNRECGRRRECTGRCCSYCLKHPLHLLAGSISLRDADVAFQRSADKIVEERKALLAGAVSDAAATDED